MKHLRMPMQDFITLMEGNTGKAVSTKEIREKYGLSREDVRIMKEKIQRKEVKVVLV